jgi:hypothetical protein
MEDVENNLQYLKVNRWRQMANYREECAFVPMEANALRGPQSQEVSE